MLQIVTQVIIKKEAVKLIRLFLQLPVFLSVITPINNAPKTHANDSY
ncbi:MAG: hypothetical protein AB4062_00535 [Crocosphaera sp.]